MSGFAAEWDGVADHSRGQAFGRDGRSRYLLGVAVLAGAYYGAAKLGYLLEVAGPVGAVVWLPVGVGIATLYLGGTALWPGVLVGDLLANDYHVLPLGSALGQTCGNLLEVLVAALLLRRLVRFGSPLESVGGVARMLIAIAVGTAVSATIGSLAQLAGGVIDADHLAVVWRTWWLGDTTGALILVPLAIAWYGRSAAEWVKGRWLETALLLVAVVGLTEVGTRTARPLTYVIFPVLIWAALRFDRRGATLAVAIVAGVTVWNASHYLGAYVFHSVSRTVVDTQLFIGVAAVTTLCLAAVVSEREAFAAGLRSSRARLVGASETERSRLLRNLHDGVQQRLTALTVRVGIAAEREAGVHDESAAVLERTGTELQLAVEELRELAHGLHPPLLVNHGLADALRDLAVRATVPVVVVALPDTRLDDGAAATAYYVVAEAVANAQKHAHAASIRIRVTEHRNVLCVEIADDGVGGATEDAGAGLQGLRDRVEAVGGSFAVDSTTRGTRITARIPVALPA
jgi:two-component system, NarL family, sensor histidine kinase FusK